MYKIRHLHQIHIRTEGISMVFEPKYKINNEMAKCLKISQQELHYNSSHRLHGLSQRDSKKF